ncbi:MAG: ATP synthase F1 subunit delta, partial [Thermodesulfobacteriota bacterium]
MRRISSGKRYAQAVFEIALERKEFESWQEGLKKIVDLSADQKLMALLENPSLSFAAKKSLLQERLRETNPLVVNLALLLVSKGLLRRSRDLLEKYNELLDAHRGIDRAKVTTVLPLGDQEKDAISQRLGKIVERKVVVDAQVEPSIIGGFIARIGDMLIDGSIHQKLETLKR